MNNRTVAENWRDQTGRARNGSSMYYHGKTIYSYGPHFPMAYITDTDYFEQNIVLQNADKYSNSTAKHQNHMRAQCHGDAVIEMSTGLLKEAISYFENNLGTIGGIKVQIEKELREKIAESTQKLARARVHKDVHQHDIDNYNTQLRILKAL
jgi:hypothetical protein